MGALPAIIESRRDEIAAWPALGLDIDIETPTSERATYRAVLPEFGLSAEGTDEDDALIVRFTTLVTTLVQRGESLPDRSAWLAVHPDRPASSRRER